LGSPHEEQNPMTATALPKARKDNIMEGRTAKWYDGVSRKRLDSYAKMARRIAGQVPPGSAVLEVAPGSGYFCIELAKLGSYSITGIEISHTFVEIAKQRAAEAGVVVDFRQGDAARMPFPDNTFDFLICSGALKNIGQPVRALQEMRRVLKPGGRGMINDLSRDVSRQSINRKIDTLGLPAFDRLIYKFLFQVNARTAAYSRAQYELMLAEARFLRVEIEEIDVNFEISMWK
jgi:ubiquinone/menaquinone biosynthesis C-methylase UbiE